jgi:RNA polymerase sigma factor (sigma-70 family)
VELTPIDEPAIGDASAILADRDLLDGALRRLEPEQRAIVVLRYYLDLSLQEMAAVLGIPIGTVKSRLHRTLAAMRILVTDDEEAAAARGAERRTA